MTPQTQPQKVVRIDSLPKRTNLTDSPTTDTPQIKQKGFLKRFLLWSGILRTSTMNKGKDEEWNLNFIAIIALMIMVVIAAFIGILVIGGFLWLDYREDARTSDAWREKRTYDNEQSLIKKCENTTLRQQGLLKILEQSNTQVPSEYAKVEQCGTATSQQSPPSGEH